MSTTEAIAELPIIPNDSLPYEIQQILIDKRVIINDQGTTTTAMTALDHHGITADITFIRDDGWAVGAPEIYEHIAYRMCKNRWVEFYRGRDIFPKPMSEYVSS